MQTPNDDIFSKFYDRTEAVCYSWHLVLISGNFNLLPDHGRLPRIQRLKCLLLRIHLVTITKTGNLCGRQVQTLWGEAICNKSAPPVNPSSLLRFNVVFLLKSACRPVGSSVISPNRTWNWASSLPPKHVCWRGCPRIHPMSLCESKDTSCNSAVARLMASKVTFPFRVRIRHPKSLIISWFIFTDWSSLRVKNRSLERNSLWMRQRHTAEPAIVPQPKQQTEALLTSPEENGTNGTLDMRFFTAIHAFSFFSAASCHQMIEISSGKRRDQQKPVA